MPVGTRLTGATSTLLIRNNYAVTPVALGVQELDTFDFPVKASAGDGDYCVQHDSHGKAWAVALDTTGTAANTPTGAIWLAIPAAQKVYLNISATTTAATVATAVKNGFNQLPGFTAVITASDAAADGHLANTSVGYLPLTAPSVHNKNDSGAGSITVAVTTAGVGYIQLIASTPDIVNRMYVNDFSGSALMIGVGAAGSEVDQFWVAPGGLTQTVDIFIPNQSRVAIRAVDFPATVNQLLITGVA